MARVWVIQFAQLRILCTYILITRDSGIKQVQARLFGLIRLKLTIQGFPNVSSGKFTPERIVVEPKCFNKCYLILKAASRKMIYNYSRSVQVVEKVTNFIF